MKRITLLTAALLFTAAAMAQQYVVIISMDGFRWDYPTRYHTPTLDSLAKAGVKAKSLIPCFPSKTFPNHYSMATGLYPDHHGIVNNDFFAPEFNDSYSIGGKNKENPKYYGGEPVWNTAMKQGVRTFSYFWVGTEVPIGGMQPEIWKSYDAKVPFVTRADSVVTWLSRPEKERPRFVLLYFQEPDMASHHNGPLSNATKSAVEELDGVLGGLCRKLRSLPIHDKINLILVSDHGMASISTSRATEISSTVKQEWISQIQSGNPVISILAKPQYYDSVRIGLSKLKHVSVYTKKTMPARLHYGQNPRTLDFVVVADSTWSVMWAKAPAKAELEATHGYDPQFTDMHGIFYASGPSFKKGVAVRSFENINVYNIVCKALSIKPAPNDGDPKLLKELFVAPKKRK